MRPTPETDRFAMLRRKIAFGDCWIWTGAKGGGGYGQVVVQYKKHYAHRLLYQLLVGPIPDGMRLEHLCKTPACCNPAHLEPVTALEAVRRSEAPSAVAARTNMCMKGLHALVPGNVTINGRGRICRACRNARLAAARVT